MTTGNFSKTSLLAIADAVYPPIGTIGHLILLKSGLSLNLATTIDATDNTLSSTTPHGLVTGSRVRIASTGAAPTPLSATTDYYAIVVSTNVIRLAANLDGATSNIPIDLTDVGTGSVTLNEQPVSADDSISVLINKELPAVNAYQRLPLSNIGQAALIDGVAVKNPQVTISNSGTTSIDFVSTLIAIGSSLAIGSTAGITTYGLVSEGFTQSVAPGQTLTISVKLETLL